MLYNQALVGSLSMNVLPRGRVERELRETRTDRGQSGELFMNSVPNRGSEPTILFGIE